MHENKSQYAGQSVNTPLGVMRVEDYYDRVFVGHHINSDHGSAVALEYQARRAKLAGEAPPNDEEVLYGKVGIVTHAVHVSEVTSVDVHPSKIVEAHEDVNEAKMENQPVSNDGPDGGKQSVPEINSGTDPAI